MWLHLEQNCYQLIKSRVQDATGDGEWPAWGVCDEYTEGSPTPQLPASDGDKETESAHRVSNLQNVTVLFCHCKEVYVNQIITKLPQLIPKESFNTREFRKLNTFV